jgi:hypothetical protein
LWRVLGGGFVGELCKILQIFAGVKVAEVGGCEL